MESKPSDRRKTAVLVVGMHRSGTSAMARVVSLAGASLPSHLMEGGLSNVDGHWEPQDVADLNEQVLADLDSEWNDTFGPRQFRSRKLPTGKYLKRAREVIRENYGDSDFIVLKEPRVSILIDFWRKALQQEEFEVCFIIMVRHPAEVAKSLWDRDKQVYNKSIILWATYMLASELTTRNSKRIFVKYDDLIEHPESTLDRIESNLDVLLPRRSWKSASEIRGFLRRDRRHHFADDSIDELKDFGEIKKFFSFLEAACSDKDWNADISAEMSEWLDKSEQITGPIIKEAEETARQRGLALSWERSTREAAELSLVEARAQVSAKEAELEQMKRDASATAEQIARLEGEIAADQAHLAARDAEIHQQIEAAQAQVEGLIGQRQEAESALGAARAEIDVLLTRSQEAEGALEASKAEVETLRQQREAVEAALEAANAQIEAAQSERDRFQAAEIEFNIRLERERTEAQSAETNAARLRAELLASQHELGLQTIRSDEQLKAAERLLGTANSRSEGLGAALSKAQGELALMVTKVEDRSSAAALATENYQRMAKSLEQAYAALEAQFSARVALASEHQARWVSREADFEAQLTAALADREAVQGLATTLEAKVAAASGRLAEEHSRSNQALALLQARLDTRISSETEFRNQLSKAEEEARKLQAEKSELCDALSQAIVNRPSSALEWLAAVGARLSGPWFRTP
jgi:hypothetical protein